MIKMNTFKIHWPVLIMIILAIISCAVIPSVVSAKEFIPTNFAFSDDYYTVDGAPNLFASIAGDTEVERGETATIRINLANKGMITRVEPAQSVGDSTSAHKKSLQELEKEASTRTKALGINAVLISDYSQIDVVSTPQTLAALRSGAVTSRPLEFTIMVNDNAAAGTYLLNLTVQYQYVDEVRMFSSGDTIRLGVTNMTYDLHYATATSVMSIPIIIKPRADFGIIAIDADVQAKGSGIVNITYKNTGELPAYDAVARLVMFRPLSVDKSQQFLGTIESGDTATASFYVSASRDAIVKAYAADSEIKYLDDDDESIISDNLKVSINVLKDNGKGGITGMQVFLILLIVAVLSYVVDIVRSRKSNHKSDN